MKSLQVLLQCFIDVFTTVLGPAGRSYRSRRLFPGSRIGINVCADSRCRLHDNTVVQQNSVLTNVTLGEFSYIAESSTLWNCTVGKYCSIGPRVRIGLGIHPSRDVVSTYPGFYTANRSVPISFRVEASIAEHQHVHIGHDVWIGAGAVILDGATIGSGSIIAAGSVVTKDVPPYAVVGGVPASIIRMRFESEDIEKLLKFEWWNRGTTFCREHAKTFHDVENFLKVVEKSSQ